MQYAYDNQGRMTSMTTWTSYAGAAGAATTTWQYDAYRGFMTNKLYADGKGTGYAYTNSGLLTKRTWARGPATTYAYSHEDLLRVVYSDSTPGITNTYDRRGRPVRIQHGTNVTTLVYNDAGQLLGETLNGITVTNVYDSLLRRISNGVVNASGSWLLRITNSYDTASRLVSVSDGVNSAAYTYVANSPLVSQIVFKQSGTTRMTTTKSYDLLNRLTSISSVPSAASAVSSAYAYNAANQRTAVTNAESARWVYQYDSLGQVVSGKKYWSDGTPVAGQQFEYAFDDIGNRKSAASGGDQYGANLRHQNYTANNLNQYIQRTVPGGVDVIGTATNTSTVTVNNQPTYRKGEYFRADLPLSNSASPVYISVTNLAVWTNGSGGDISTNFVGNIFVPKTAELFTYDLDGNLTNDGRWSLVWNAENRLIQMLSTNVPDAAKRKLDFVYDARGRRIRKTVSTWSGSAWVVSSDVKFAYDGWNLLAELNATNSAVTRSFMWGTDLSGTLQGAGGVGGLLAVNTGSGVHFAAYDGNGNIAGLVSAADGAISANYEYGPFGESLRVNGAAAAANPFRFATKYEDQDSGSLDYGRRHYNPILGVWSSRDIIGENDGPNIYAMVRNSPINLVDRNGLESWAFVGHYQNGQFRYVPPPWQPPPSQEAIYDVQPYDLEYERNPVVTADKWRIAAQEWIGEPGSREHTAEGLLRDLKRRVRVCGCIKRLVLIAHANEGYVNLPDGMRISEDAVAQAKNLGISPEQSSFPDEHAFLSKVKPFLCKGAVVEFAQCYSGRNSPNLRKYLEETFGSDTTVILHDKCVRVWIDGSVSEKGGLK